MVEIIWHGHACFELRGSRVTVVFDPFGGIGMPEPKAKADIVLCSHSHRDHNNVAPVLKRGGTVLEGFTGPYTYFQGVPIQGIATFHDTAEGSQRGRNSIYVIQLDDVVFCHLGDLGHDLSEKQVGWIGAVDVLFAPVGGGPTIGPDLATSIVQRLNPMIVVPMHYSLGLSGVAEFLNRLKKVDAFLKDKKTVEKIDSRSFFITRENLPPDQKIVVLSFQAEI